MPENEIERAMEQKIQTFRQSYDMAWIQLGLTASLVINTIEIVLLIYIVMQWTGLNNRFEKFESTFKVVEDYIVRKGDNAKPN